MDVSSLGGEIEPSYEDLKLQLQACQFKCKQFKTELENVDVVCYLLKQENQILMNQLHEMESLVETNKVENEKVISELKSQIDCSNRELESLRKITPATIEHAKKAFVNIMNM